MRKTTKKSNSGHVQIVREEKLPMSKNLKTESAFVQILVRSPVFLILRSPICGPFFAFCVLVSVHLVFPFILCSSSVKT